MPLSWNEIKTRAYAFTKEWREVYSEDAEAKSFWDNFFKVFGISRKRVAGFEEPVKKLGDRQGFIDLFWKGVLVVEHKSRGKSAQGGTSTAVPQLKLNYLAWCFMPTAPSAFAIFTLIHINNVRV